ncbi:MAG: FKBP-type peptidyl-prolyl cis-trans isomerase [Glaciecola sp.]|jgi:peptidylprolyl isomerase
MKYILIGLIVCVVLFLLYKSNEAKKIAQENIAIGQQVAAENTAKGNISTTVSGLQYEVLSKGTSTEQPTASDTVKVHYHGTLLNGKVFDSSVDRGTPISFPLHRVIPGWTEGLQLMNVGDTFRFYIPAHLAYGNNAAGTIPPGSTLVFEVELLAIE